MRVSVSVVMVVVMVMVMVVMIVVIVVVMIVVIVVVVVVVVMRARHLFVLGKLVLDGQSARPWRHKYAPSALILPRLWHTGVYRGRGRAPARMSRPAGLEAGAGAAIALAVDRFRREAVGARRAAIHVHVGTHWRRSGGQVRAGVGVSGVRGGV